MASADLAIYPTQMPRTLSANGVSIREDVLYTDAKGEPDEGAPMKRSPTCGTSCRAYWNRKRPSYSSSKAARHPSGSWNSSSWAGMCTA